MVTNKEGTGVLRQGWGRDVNGTNGIIRLTSLHGTGKKSFLNIVKGALSIQGNAEEAH